MKPANYDSLKHNEELWGLFDKVGITPIFQSMQGYNDALTYKFTNFWSDGEVKIGGLHFTMTKKLIFQATGLKYEGKKIVKKSSSNYQEFINKFFKAKEKAKRFQNEYARLKHPPPYHNVCLHIMRYFTLEGCFMFVHGYHFPILNHVQHLEKINLPFFLFFCLSSKIWRMAQTLPYIRGLLGLFISFS